MPFLSVIITWYSRATHSKRLLSEKKSEQGSNQSAPEGCSRINTIGVALWCFLAWVFW